MGRQYGRCSIGIILFGKGWKWSAGDIRKRGECCGEAAAKTKKYYTAKSLQIYQLSLFLQLIQNHKKTSK
jgi:hypothetical protein